MKNSIPILHKNEGLKRMYCYWPHISSTLHKPLMKVLALKNWRPGREEMARVDSFFPPCWTCFQFPLQAPGWSAFI